MIQKQLKTLEIFLDSKIKYSKSIKEALTKSQCVIIMTQWDQYTKLNNNQFNHMTRKISY